MKKEILQSILRALIQLLGILVAMSVSIPFLPEAFDAINFISVSLDSIWSAANEIIGFAITLIAFFYDKERFDDREIGAKIKLKAKLKGVSVSKIIHDL